MRKLVSLIVLAAALSWAASASATFSNTPYKGMQRADGGNPDTCSGPHSGGTYGRSYSGVQTNAGASGFSTNPPASPITRTMDMSTIHGGLNSTAHFTGGYFGVGQVSPNGETGSWLQVGETLGLAPANGWYGFPTGQQYTEGWHMYVEQYDNVTFQYRYQDEGLSSATDHFSITQNTDGTFTAKINGTTVASAARVPSSPGPGRVLQAIQENGSGDGLGCDSGDIYWNPLGNTVYYNARHWSVPTLDVCTRKGSLYYTEWETWNKQFSPSPGHGLPGPGTYQCMF